MTRQERNLFDWIAEGINSLGAVLMAMLFTIGGMVFFSHTLFSHVFPDSMSTWERLVAAWFMAFGWEFTVLITTVNHKHIPKMIPRIMAICSGVIVLFFIDAFDPEISNTQTAMRLFVGLLVSTVNYIYVELFNAKWTERIAHKLMPAKLEQAQSTLNQLESTLNQREREFNELQRALDEQAIKLKELEAFKKANEQERTCQHCKTVFDRVGTAQAHKGYCSENPSRKVKDGIKINGHSHERV